MWRAGRYVDGVELGVHVPYYFDEKGVHTAALDAWHTPSQLRHVDSFRGSSSVPFDAVPRGVRGPVVFALRWCLCRK